MASSGGPAGLTAVKKVHLCEVATPCGKLSHSGEKLSFCYDSVLEYSFMKKSISCKIKKKKLLHATVTMTIIGQASVNSTV